MLVGILILCAMFCNPMIENWNDSPAVYIFPVGIALLSSISIWIKIKDKAMGITIVDAILLFFLGGITLLETQCILRSSYLSDGYIIVFAIFGLYLILRTIVGKNEDYLGWFIGALIVNEILISYYQLILTLLTHTLLIGHVQGTFKNSGVLIIFLTSCLPIIFVMGQRDSRHRIFKYMAILLFILIAFLAIVLTSRTGILLILLSLWFINRRRISNLWKGNFTSRLLMTSLIFVALSAGIGILFYFKYPSSIGRLFIWKISWRMICSKPLLGWGINGFESNYLNYQAGYFRLHPATAAAVKYTADEVTSPFNEFIFIVIEFGLVGFSIFLFGVYKCLMVYKRYRTFELDHYAFSLVLIFISATVYYSFHVSLILIVGVIILAKIAAGTPVFKFHDYKYGIRVLVTLVSFVMVIYYSMQCRATFLWRQGNEIWSKKKVFVSDYFEPVYPALRHRSNFLFNYAAIAFSSHQYPKAISLFEENKKIRVGVDLLIYLGNAYEFTGNHMKAKECFENAIEIVPSRFSAKYFLAEVFIKLGDIQSALSMAKEIVKMPIKIPSAEVNQMKFEMSLLLLKYKQTWQ